MTLREARGMFTDRLAQLILKINSTPPYNCTIGEASRTDEQAIIHALKEGGRMRLAALLGTVAEFHGLAIAVANNGKANGVILSLHRDGLAADINLYKNGVYCEGAEEHKQFGEWWKAQGPPGTFCWGGDFGDANHYSVGWQGRK